MDNALVQYFLERLQVDYNINFHETDHNSEKIIKWKLKGKIQDFKESFTRSPSNSFYVERIAKNPQNEWIDMEIDMTITAFNNICQPMVDRTIGFLDKVLREAKVTKQQIDTVLLVGGSTRLPAVKNALSLMFPGKINQSVNPDEAVANGAAVLGAFLSKTPAQKISDITIRDVISLPIGVGIFEDKFSIHFEKSTPIPCKMTIPYGASADDQSNAYVPIYEGEDREKASNNTRLGQLTVPLPPGLKANEICVECTFNVDDNGILHVDVLNLKDNKTHRATIKYQSILSPDELQTHISAEQDFLAKSAIHEQLSTIITIVLVGIEDLTGLPMGVTQTQLDTIEEAANAAHAWASAHSIYDPTVTIAMFQHHIDQITKVKNAYEVFYEIYNSPKS